MPLSTNPALSLSYRPQRIFINSGLFGLWFGLVDEFVAGRICYRLKMTLFYFKCVRFSTLWRCCWQIRICTEFLTISKYSRKGRKCTSNRCLKVQCINWLIRNEEETLQFFTIFINQQDARMHSGLICQVMWHGVKNVHLFKLMTQHFLDNIYGGPLDKSWMTLSFEYLIISYQ